MSKTLKDRLNRMAEDAPASKWGDLIKARKQRKQIIAKMAEDDFQDEIWQSITGNLNRL